MRRIILLGFLCAAGTRVEAQTYHFIWRTPDCNMRRLAYDNPLPGYGAWEPRGEWHRVNIEISVGLSLTIGATTELSPMQSAAAAWTGDFVLPHAIGILSHEYPIDLRDLAYDATSRSLPLVIAEVVRTDNMYVKFLLPVVYVGAYAATRCWSSP